MLAILESFLVDRQQRVTLDSECSDWAGIEAGVPQGSILGPILFLIYINDLFEVVSSDIRIFADDTFIFRIIDQSSALELSRDLDRITDWAHAWKMLFNPDLSKQAVEVVFSKKRTKSIVLPLTFNGIAVKQADETKHLGIILDSKLNFKLHLDEKLANARSGLGLMKQLKKWVSHRVLENIYKLYVRPNLDYADVIYHKAAQKVSIFNNEITDLLMSSVESIQIEAGRIVSGAWKGTNTDKLYKNLGWESLQDRRTMRKLCIIYETLDTRFPNYLHDSLELQKYHQNSRFYNQMLLKPIHCSNPYKHSFFPATITDWNKLDREVKESNSKTIFKKRILNIIRPKKASYFGMRCNDRVRYLTMLRVELSPLRDHKFRHGFLDTSNNKCLVCGAKEDTRHYLTSCISFNLSRATLMQNVSEVVNFDMSNLLDKEVVHTFLFGRVDLNDQKKLLILNFVVDFIVKTKRLDTHREGGGGIDLVNQP